MTFRPSGPARPPDARAALRLPRWPRYLVPVIVGLVAFVVVLIIVAGVWTDFLWFRSVHYGSVFGVTYGTRWALFFIGGIFMAVVTGVNAVIASGSGRPTARSPRSVPASRPTGWPSTRTGGCCSGSRWAWWG